MNTAVIALIIAGTLVSSFFGVLDVDAKKIKLINELTNKTARMDVIGVDQCIAKPNLGTCIVDGVTFPNEVEVFVPAPFDADNPWHYTFCCVGEQTLSAGCDVKVKEPLASPGGSHTKC